MAGPETPQRQTGVTESQTPDGAVVETTYSIAATGSNIGTAVTVKDQSLKLRRSITNALGQLTQVDEPNNAGQLGAIDAPYQPTFYTFDLLNNLTQVQQPGDTEEECGSIAATPCSQPRSFQYDSLSRLKQATNPESGTILYSYDANSNLQTKTDARQVVTTFAYDALNRVKTRTYSAPGGLQNYQATPDVSYYYDNLTNAKGKLIKVTNGTGADRSTTEYVSFDILGRVTRSIQTTDGITYGGGTDQTKWMTYTYNLSGALVEQQYPSGRVVKNVLDSDGELATVQSKKNSTHAFWNYANHFAYNAVGAVTSLQLGNGRWESTQFNNRLQPTQIALGSLQNGTDRLKLNYEYGALDVGTGQTVAGTNNGNVSKQVITVGAAGATPGFVATQYYAYDSLNRLEIATENILPDGQPLELGWRQHFKFDRYGNRNFVTTGDTATTTLGTCPTEVCNPTISPSDNKITSTGHLFDAVGNTTRDAQDRKFTYDAENKQTKVEWLIAGTQTVTGTVGEYFYDGDGKRIKKRAYQSGVLTEETIFVYDAAAKLMGEYSNQVASSQDAKVSYLTADHLGSPRINTDINGNVTARHDYHPFGEEVVTSKRAPGLGYADDAVMKQFTGYERDSETDLDYSQARYLNFRAGRFSSPDSFTNDTRLSAPQGWNLYVYVRNNPLTWVDASGRKGTVSWYTDDDGVLHVRLTASFALYGADGQNVTKKDLQAYKKLLVEGIKELLTKQGSVNGKRVSVTADISAKVYSSKQKAEESGRANVVELGYDQLQTTKSVAGVAFAVPGEGFDRMAAKVEPNIGDYDSRSSTADFLVRIAKNTFAHEFTHLVGALHNYNANEADSLLSEDGGKGRIFESDLKQIIFGYNDTTYAPPPPAGQPDTRVRPSYTLAPSGMSPRRAPHLASTPSDVYRWVKEVSR